MSFIGDLFGGALKLPDDKTKPAFVAGNQPLPGAIDQPPQKPADPDELLNRKIPAEPATQSSPLGQTSLLGGGSNTGIY